MSNGPIPLITEADLGFQTVYSDFSGLVAFMLGNLGTDSDGFDVFFNDAATLAADAGTVLESFDGDLTDMGVAVPQADSGSITAQLAELQPAAAAVDASLHDYTNLNPVPVPDAGGGGSTPPPPNLSTFTPVDVTPVLDPTPATDFPNGYGPAQCSYAPVLYTFKVGQYIGNFILDTGAFVVGDQTASLTLEEGDPQMVTLGSGHVEGSTTYWFSVKGIKAGRFPFRIAMHSQAGRTYYFCAVAQVNPA